MEKNKMTKALEYLTSRQDSIARQEKALDKYKKNVKAIFDKWKKAIHNK